MKSLQWDISRDSDILRTDAIEEESNLDAKVFQVTEPFSTKSELDYKQSTDDLNSRATMSQETLQTRSPRLTHWVAFLIFSTITMGAASELVSETIVHHS